MDLLTNHELRDRIMLDKRVKHPQFRIICCLLFHRNSKTRKCCPAHSTIGKEVGMGTSTVRGHLAGLKDLGYVDWKKGGDQRPNQYWFEALGDPKIMTIRPATDRQHSSSQSQDRPPENQQSVKEQTARFQQPDRQLSSNLTARKSAPNSLIEPVKELGTVPPAGERVPDTPNSLEDIKSQNSAIRDTIEFDADYFEMNIGLDHLEL